MDARIIAVLIGFVLSLAHSAPKLQSNHRQIKINKVNFNKKSIRDVNDARDYGVVLESSNTIEDVTQDDVTKRNYYTYVDSDDDINVTHIDDHKDGGQNNNTTDRDGVNGELSSYEDTSGHVVTTQDPCLNRNTSGTDTDNLSKTRSVRVGDTFTPRELLPISTKLIRKVTPPGSGKGFVSSESSARTLADKLFTAYFQSRRRIVILKEVNISGLDALQALALSGSSADLRESQHLITESPISNEQHDDHFILQSRYKLLLKNIDGDKVSKDNRRHRVNLTKNLAKKRKLVLNLSRRKRHHRKHKKKSQNAYRPRSYASNSYQFEPPGVRRKKENNESTSTPKCRWRYECARESDQSSCHIHPDCTNQKDSTYIGGPALNTEIIRTFRNKVKIYSIDDEVNKIVQRHLLTIRPTRVNDLQFENINDYFKRLIINKEVYKNVSGSGGGEDDGMHKSVEGMKKHATTTSSTLNDQVEILSSAEISQAPQPDPPQSTPDYEQPPADYDNYQPPPSEYDQPPSDYEAQPDGAPVDDGGGGGDYDAPPVDDSPPGNVQKELALDVKDDESNGTNQAPVEEEIPEDAADVKAKPQQELALGDNVDDEQKNDTEEINYEATPVDTGVPQEAHQMLGLHIRPRPKMTTERILLPGLEEDYIEGNWAEENEEESENSERQPNVDLAGLSEVPSSIYSSGDIDSSSESEESDSSASWDTSHSRRHYYRPRLWTAREGRRHITKDKKKVKNIEI